MMPHSLMPLNFMPPKSNDTDFDTPKSESLESNVPKSDADKSDASAVYTKEYNAPDYGIGESDSIFYPYGQSQIQCRGFRCHQI